MKKTVLPASGSPGSDTAAATSAEILRGAVANHATAAPAATRTAARPSEDAIRALISAVDGSYCCFALYFSWQPPQFWSTPGIAALKLASSLIASRAAVASAPNFLKRACRSAMLSSSQIAGKALVSPVLLSGGKRAELLACRVLVSLQRVLRRREVERSLALQHRNDRPQRLAVGLHQGAPLLDRVGARRRRSIPAVAAIASAANVVLIMGPSFSIVPVPGDANCKHAIRRFETKNFVSAQRHWQS